MSKNKKDVIKSKQIEKLIFLRIEKLSSEKLIKQTLVEKNKCIADKTKANISKIKPSSATNLFFLL